MSASSGSNTGAGWDPGTPDLEAGPSVEGLKGGSEIAKQLITLSVGMIGLTITFLKDIVGGGSAGASGVPAWMLGAWAMYTLCILASIGTLMGICGAMTVLDQKAMKLNVRPDHEGSYDVYAKTVRAPMLVMVLSFLLAIAMTIAAAASAQDDTASRSAKESNLLQAHCQDRTEQRRKTNFN